MHIYKSDDNWNVIIRLAGVNKLGLYQKRTKHHSAEVKIEEKNNSSCSVLFAKR